MWCIVGAACYAIVGCSGESSGGGSAETKGTATRTAAVPLGPYAYAVAQDPLSRVARIRAYVVPAGGGQSREITKRSGLVKDPVLTADRKRLAYLVIDPKAKTTDLRMQGLDGSMDRRVLLIHRGVFGLAIAPDGSSLVASMAPTGTGWLCICTRSSHPTAVSRGSPTTARRVAELDPAYSGTRRVDYRRFADERTAGDIYNAGLGRSTPHKLIATPRDQAQPRPSPGGKRCSTTPEPTERTRTPDWRSRAGSSPRGVTP
jgi:Tol biopolymer transport system component